MDDGSPDIILCQEVSPPGDGRMVGWGGFRISLPTIAIKGDSSPVAEIAGMIQADKERMCLAHIFLG